MLTDAKQRKLSFIKQALLAIASHAVLFGAAILLGRSVIRLPYERLCGSYTSQGQDSKFKNAETIENNGGNNAPLSKRRRKQIYSNILILCTTWNNGVTEMARIYTRSFLNAIYSSISPKPLSTGLWRCLLDIGISKKKPTRPGCRAGQRKFRPTGGKIPSSFLQYSYLPSTKDGNTNLNFDFEAQDGRHLHIVLPSTLNIQTDTSDSGQI